MSKIPAILLVEDTDDDACFVLRELRRGWATVEVERVASSDDVRRAMRERHFDLVLADYHLPPEEFPTIAQAVRDCDPDIPIIVISGTIGEERAVELMRGGGVADLILKGSLSRLVPAIHRELDGAVVRAAERESRQRFMDIVEVCGNWLWETDAEHRFTFFSWQDAPSSGAQLDLLGKTRWELAAVDPAADRVWQAHLADLSARRKFRNFRYDATTPAGKRRHICVSGVPVFDRHGDFAGYRGMSVDETDLVVAHARASAAETLLQDTIESISEGVVVFDTEDRFVLTNEAFRELYSDVADLAEPGMPYADFLHASIQRGIHPDAAGREADWLAGRLRYRQELDGAILERLGDGRFVLIAERRMRNGGIAGLKMDVTAVKKLEAERDRLAHHDALTGLPDKELFIDYTRHAVAGAKRKDEIAAVISLRLTSLDDIMQSFGLDAGDGAVMEVVARLRGAVSDEEALSYVGGGQFLLLLVGIHSKAQVLASGERLARRFRAGFQHEGEEAPFKVAIGISTAPGDSTDPHALVRNATTAMHQACQRPVHSVQFYDAGMTEAAVRRSKTERELKRAIDADELFLVYQPQVDAHSHELVGAEALVRWRHAERGIVPPAEFIPIAEETGLIVPIGERVLHKACEQAAIWQRHGRGVPIAINVSAVQLARTDLAQTVLSALDRHGLAPSSIVLELTESAVLRDVNAATATMQGLSEAGVPFAIDDFGIEQSSLAYLSNLPFATLKIDRAFVSRMTGDRGHAAMIQMIISMAHSLGMEALAEGVERMDQVIYLRAYGCDKLQGYLFSRPLDADGFEPLFRNRTLAPDTALAVPIAATGAISSSRAG